MPRPLPEGLPVVLGPFGGVLLPAAADLALAAKEPLGTEPPLALAVADCMRDAAAFDIDLDIVRLLDWLSDCVPAGTFSMV